MKLAIFDFDGTLFPKDTLPFLLSQWRKQNRPKTKLLKVYIPLLPMYLLYKSKLKTRITKDEIREKAVTEFLKIFDGIPQDDIEQYFHQSFNEMQKLLNQKVVDEVIMANQNGYHTVILSGAYQPFLEHFADYMNIKTIIGTKMHFHNGSVDRSKLPDIVTGANKLEKLTSYFQDTIDWQNSLAYADSFSDLALLESVGQPTAVMPDEQLADIATNRNWRVIL